ncbi:hypothetical protein [Streptacidiphilus albus]|jgi:hypothetical protein|uniref:hypothetical protein n=1 Tax=Streptacidiphilus albus TaxID=105425 RepID=UPI00054B705A|nr:hypothetical protein [Streptacidiphilus albus]
MNLHSDAHMHDQATALRHVREATAEHARTRRVLDAAIAEATAVGVPPEALHDVGQCEPGHGKHAGSEDVGAPAQFDAFVHAEEF